MSIHFGEVPASSTLYIPFASYGKTNGESITLSGLAVTDIEIYKDGSTTQRASDAGYTLLDTDGIDFDGITGIHGFSIDLSDDTDAGFYAAGSTYWVIVSAVTVDSQTVNFIAATFRIRSGDIPTANENADALLDRAAGVETGLTIRQAFRLFAAALLGKASGLGTTTAVFRDTGDSKDRISATVDADGNRTAVTLDAT